MSEKMLSKFGGVTHKQQRTLRQPKYSEYYLLNDELNTNSNRHLRLYRASNGHVFGVSIIKDNKARFMLASALKDPVKYRTKIHTINGFQEPLHELLQFADEFPFLRDVEATDIVYSKIVPNNIVNYMMTVGAKGVSLYRNDKYFSGMEFRKPSNDLPKVALY